MLYPTCEVYDISTILKVDYSFILIIGVLGLYVWKPGLKSFIDNSSAWVKCGVFLQTTTKKEKEENPLLIKKKSFVANKIVFYNGRTFCMTCLVLFMKRKYKLLWAIWNKIRLNFCEICITKVWKTMLWCNTKITFVTKKKKKKKK